jgi:hypothetical protein
MLQSKPAPDGSRYHIWHPDLIDHTLEAPIHTHRWDLKSTILYGSLADELIQVYPEPYLGAYVEVVTANSELPCVNTQYTEADRVNFISTPRLFSRDQTYTIPRGVYHKTTPRELTVTRIERSGISGYSTVLTPYGVIPRNGVERYDEKRIKYYLGMVAHINLSV